MEKKKFMHRIFALVLAALMLVAFVGFLAGCVKKVTKGEVIDKTFSPANVQYSLVPIVISNGKAIHAYYVPYVYRYPDTYTITISGKGDGGKEETATYRVTKDVYDSVPLGAEFIYEPDMEPDEPEYQREPDLEESDDG